ncbi:MAG: hypothetical protein V3V67_02410 [Myxococcota bacterium]
MQGEDYAPGASAVRAAGRGSVGVLVLVTWLLTVGAAPPATANDALDSAFLASISPAIHVSHGFPRLGSVQRTVYGDEHWYSPLARSLATFATSAKATRDALRFPLAIDHASSDRPVALQLPGRLQVTADFAGTISRDRYVGTSRVASPAAARTLDWTLEANVGLSRAITQRTRIEIGWRVIRNRSNYEIYDYDRSIWGIYVRTQLY